jgi:uncharacterized protein DUF262
MQDFLNSTRRTVSVYKKAHDENRLKLKPPFQRNLVWTDAQKSYLIDSILRGYPIPELYIQETVDAKGSEFFTVVDGQQRLRACLEFLEGKLTLTPNEAPDWPDYTFDDLTPADKAKVYGYNFIVRQLPEVAEDELRIIFRRLNRNVVALNQQELRHATYWGPFITSMERISDLDFWTKSGIFTANDIRRMLDVEFVSEVAIAYLHGVPNKKATLDKWYATYEREYPYEQQVEDCFNKVLGELSHILPNIAATRWSKKSDFYSLFLCLANHVKKLPLSKSGRVEATRRLVKFGQAVDKFLSTQKSTSLTVRKYGAAVERAASDQNNRVKRGEVLEVVLKTAW